MLSRVIALLLEGKKKWGVEEERRKGERHRDRQMERERRKERRDFQSERNERNVTRVEEIEKDTQELCQLQPKRFCNRQTVFPSCRPHGYVRSMWHMEPVYWGKRIAGQLKFSSAHLTMKHCHGPLSAHHIHFRLALCDADITKRLTSCCSLKTEWLIECMCV